MPKSKLAIEYEATFTNINKDDMRRKLKELGAKKVKPETLMKRATFNLPTGHEITGGWARVRDEGDKITMSIKIVSGDKIDDQKEVVLKVDDFDQAVLFMTTIGCSEKAYQENKREPWLLDGVEITLDEWPFIEPFVEVEGESEEVVKQASEKLGFNYKNAKFCAITTLYHEKYGVSEDIINNKTPRIVFGEPNPFLKNENH